MANTNLFPKKVSEYLPQVSLTTAEDTITFITGYDAHVLGQSMGGAGNPGYRTKTVGRKIQITGDTAWAIGDATGVIGTKDQVAAGVPYVIELVKETQQFFVMAVSTAKLTMLVIG